jgi:hypothetical protein
MRPSPPMEHATCECIYERSQVVYRKLISLELLDEAQLSLLANRLIHMYVVLDVTTIRTVQLRAW